MSKEIRFGSSRKQLQAKDVKSLNKIAKQFGATFVETVKDGKYNCYFAAPNRGDPFDNIIARAVVDAVKLAKIKLW
jgi:hypothetical protein